MFAETLKYVLPKDSFDSTGANFGGLIHTLDGASQMDDEIEPSN